MHSMTNTELRYGLVAQGLHWAVVALICVQYLLAELAEEEGHETAAELALLANHRSLGITIGLLAILRVLWRWITPPPPMRITLPAWQRGLAKTTHFALYAVLFALPLSGWLLTSADGTRAVWFGLFPLPNLIPAGDAMEDLFEEVHEVLAGVLLALVGLHVAGALKHALLDRDDTLRRISSAPVLVLFALLLGGTGWLLTQF